GRVERQVDVAADVGVRKRLVEDVEEPDPDLELLVAGNAEVLEQCQVVIGPQDRKSTRLNSSHVEISYAVFCLKKKKVTRNGSSGPRYAIACRLQSCADGPHC